MKNRLPFAALTIAFTIAGACIGYTMHDNSESINALIFVAFIGGVAAAVSGDNL
jgi:RsiW-degrading membrane proteinase PrsW (M82 family)